MFGIALGRFVDAGPRELFLFLALVFGLLAAVPGVREASNAATSFTKVAYPLLIFCVLYVTSTIINGHLKPTAATVVLILLLIATTSTQLSTDPDVTKIYIQTLLVPLFIFLGLQSAGEYHRNAAASMLRQLLLVACCIGVLYYVYYARAGILSPSFIFGHHYNQDFQDSVGRHLYGNPNNASVVYLTALGTGLHHLRSTPDHKKLAVGAVLVEASAVLITGSTGAVVSGIVLVVLASLKRLRTTAEFLRLYVFLCVTASGVAIWRLRYAYLGSTRGVSGRLDARAVGLRAISNHFWFGSGPGSSGRTLDQQLSNALQENLTGSYTTAHDMFINWGLDLGFPAMVLLFAVVVVATYRLARSGRWTAVLPLVGFLLGAESSGIPIVQGSNPVWAVVLWTLLGLGWACYPHQLKMAPQAPDRGSMIRN